MNNKHFPISDVLISMTDQTGKLPGVITDDSNPDFSTLSDEAVRLINDHTHIHPWFTKLCIQKSLRIMYAGLKSGIEPGFLNRDYRHNKVIAFVINPGAPFEGAGEVIFAAVNGFQCLVKLPPECVTIYRSLFNYLAEKIDGLSERINFFSGRLPAFDGIIGINAFEGSGAVSYISRKPNLLIYHKGCAVKLTGNESEEELGRIAGGICDFFGRSFFSVRSVSVPSGYNFQALFSALERYSGNSENHRYFNHYEYHKSLMLINNIHHLDNGFILLTKDKSLTGKTGVVTYSEYNVEDGMLSSLNNKNSGRNADNQEVINGILPSEKVLFYNAGRVAGFLSEL